MDANEAQEEYEEVQTELRKKEEEVSGVLVKVHGGTERKAAFVLYSHSQTYSGFCLTGHCSQNHSAMCYVQEQYLTVNSDKAYPAVFFVIVIIIQY